MNEHLNNPEQPEENPQPPINPEGAVANPDINAGSSADAAPAGGAMTPQPVEAESPAEGRAPGAMSEDGDAAMMQAMIDESEADSQAPVDNTSIEMPSVRRADFGELDTGDAYVPPQGNIELLLDVSLPVAIELGRTKMSIKDILELGAGSIVELDRLAGEPVDILVNARPLAKGEVVVLDEHFGVRITSLVSPRERLENLGA